MEVRFGALRLVVLAFRTVAWLQLALGIVLGLAALAGVVLGDRAGAVQAYVPARTMALGALLILALALAGFALVRGAARLIEVLLSIEAQSRELADRLTEATRRQQRP